MHLHGSFQDTQHALLLLQPQPLLLALLLLQLLPLNSHREDVISQPQAPVQEHLPTRQAAANLLDHQLQRARCSNCHIAGVKKVRPRPLQ
jgi:hypothetical protein